MEVAKDKQGSPIIVKGLVGLALVAVIGCVLLGAFIFKIDDPDKKAKQTNSKSFLTNMI